jgi:hypothetical protein
MDIPAETAEMIRRRCADIVRACMYEPNIIDAIVLSCYGQGLQDALQVIEQRPMLLEELQEVTGYGHGV